MPHLESSGKNRALRLANCPPPAPWEPPCWPNPASYSIIEGSLVSKIWSVRIQGMDISMGNWIRRPMVNSRKNSLNQSWERSQHCCRASRGMREKAWVIRRKHQKILDLTFLKKNIFYSSFIVLGTEQVLKNTTPLVDLALLDLKASLTSIEKKVFGEFLGGPVVRILYFHC